MKMKIPALEAPSSLRPLDAHAKEWIYHKYRGGGGTVIQIIRSADLLAGAALQTL